MSYVAAGFGWLYLHIWLRFFVCFIYHAWHDYESVHGPDESLDECNRCGALREHESPGMVHWLLLVTFSAYTVPDKQLVRPEANE